MNLNSPGAARASFTESSAGEATERLELTQTAHDYLEWYQRATVLRHERRYSEALASYDRALELRPHDWAWYDRGNVLADLKRYAVMTGLWSYDPMITGLGISGVMP